MNANTVLYEGRVPEAGSAPRVEKYAASLPAKAVFSDVFSAVVLPPLAYGCGDLEGLVVETKPREDGLPDLASNTEAGGE